MAVDNTIGQLDNKIGSPEGAKHLAKCLLAAGRLESLNLSQNKLGKAGKPAGEVLEAIGRLSMLRDLRLAKNKLSPGQIDVLAAHASGISALTKLDLSNNE
ncbi:hypothetical protein T484DRAFT_1913728, partial [Baffinella frigidus]